MKENINHPPDAPNLLKDLVEQSGVPLSQKEIEELEGQLWNVNSTTNQPFCITYKRDNESKNP
jgi:hypothetical protein